MRPRIYINGRFLTQPLTGVQRYARELLHALDEINPEVELVCLVPPEKFTQPALRNVTLKGIGRNRGNFWEQFDLPLWLKGKFLFSPANIGPAFYANQAVTLHDASIFAVPDAYSWTFKFKYRFVFHQLAKRARCIITDSVFSQHELARWLGKETDKFNVVFLGGDHLVQIPSDESILDRFDMRDRAFMLMVASQSPHKNIRRLLESLRQLKGDAMRFVLAGGNFETVFQNAGLASLPENVIRVNYVSDSELRALYENAYGFIIPSLYEGFGLPILEAMNCDCPVLSSNAASLQEVGGDAALYFDPLDVAAMTTTLQRFVSSPGLQRELRRRGKVHASRFTWDETAHRTLELLLPLANQTGID